MLWLSVCVCWCVACDSLSAGCTVRLPGTLCICMCGWGCVRVCVCACVSVHRHTHTRTHTRAHTRTHTSTHTQTQTPTHTARLCKCVRVCAHLCGVVLQMQRSTCSSHRGGSQSCCVRCARRNKSPINSSASCSVFAHPLACSCSGIER